LSAHGIPLGSYLMSFRFLQVGMDGVLEKPANFRIMMRRMSVARKTSKTADRAQALPPLSSDCFVCSSTDRHADLISRSASPLAALPR
jgi:DNA-binding response OmpR family regulator